MFFVSCVWVGGVCVFSCVCFRLTSPSSMLLCTGRPGVELLNSKPSDVGIRVRISVQSHELGFCLTKNNGYINHAQQVENE